MLDLPAQGAVGCRGKGLPEDSPDSKQLLDIGSFQVQKIAHQYAPSGKIY